MTVMVILFACNIKLSSSQLAKLNFTIHKTLICKKCFADIDPYSYPAYAPVTYSINSCCFPFPAFTCSILQSNLSRYLLFRTTFRK